MTTEAEWMDAIASIALDVDDAYVNPSAVYSMGGGEAVTGVKDLPDDVGVALPAFVLMDKGYEADPVAGSRLNWLLEGTHWFEYSPRGERLRLMLEARRALRVAFAAKGKGNRAVLTSPDQTVQVVNIVAASEPEARKWTPGDSQPTYLVITYRIQVRVNEFMTLTPA